MEIDTVKQTLDAIFENGVFKPLKSPQLPEGLHVRLEVEIAPGDNTEDLLELAAQVYEGLSEQQINEIEHIALDRRDFFGESIP